jgi:hypothetical protein
MSALSLALSVGNKATPMKGSRLTKDICAHDVQTPILIGIINNQKNNKPNRAIVKDIQLNTDGEVISVGNLELNEPMNVESFVLMMQNTRKAVEFYLDQLQFADKKLAEFFDEEGQAAKIARQFRDKLISDISQERGIIIHIFEAVEEVKPVRNEELVEGNEKISINASPMDWHIEYRNLQTTMDIQTDLNARRIVFLCDNALLDATSPSERANKRDTIKINTDYLWDYIKQAYLGLSEALDPRIRGELPALLISAGWRVIGGMRHSDALYMLPYGVGVPGCFLAKDKKKDDHPFWGI